MILDLQQQQKLQNEIDWMASWLSLIGLELQKRKIAEHLESLTIVVAFVSDQKMQELNSQFRGKDYTTDILSFGPVEENFLGELVIAESKIQEQSIENRHSFRCELSYMLLHGVLHLLGYDHEEPDEREEMFSLQEDIFAQLFSE